jgi:diaminohydroxyphosphoribosylaminopyrimidine deaminase/5-amino-6-(5-phosphoribosylamino)uracil reductase
MAEKSSSSGGADEHYMRMALALAQKAAGRTSPNPMVGAVLVRGGKVIATGYHRQAGGPHAEIDALRRAGVKARGATLYLNLEPCSHYGRTPPCADAVIAAGVKSVVAGMADPNPLVSGRGSAAYETPGFASARASSRPKAARSTNLLLNILPVNCRSFCSSSLRRSTARSRPRPGARVG